MLRKKTGLRNAIKQFNMMPQAEPFFRVLSCSIAMPRDKTALRNPPLVSENSIPIVLLLVTALN
jgi:hypothetical protein